MDCPVCGNQMKKGFLKSRSKIIWVPDIHNDQIEDTIENIGKLNVDFESSSVSGYYCRKCNRIDFSISMPKENDVYCPSCGEIVSDSLKFCPKCGGQIQVNVKNTLFLCLNCKQPVSKDETICPNCGIELDQFAFDLLNTCVECGYSDPSLEDLSECPKCGAILPI